MHESKFCKAKYNRGRNLNMRDGWVLGGIERNTRRCFLESVPCRDSQTLMPIITKWVEPGTTIITDEWRAYQQLGNMGYVHLTVNHSANFVDPLTGAHTQNVESMLARIKGRFKKMYGTSGDLKTTYYAEFMWRERYGALPFGYFITQLPEKYI